MIAATKSRIECNASDKMPRLPVRSTRNTFSDTNKTAEPTEARAANRFSRVAPARGSKAIGGLYALVPTRNAALRERGRRSGRPGGAENVVDDDEFVSSRIGQFVSSRNGRRMGEGAALAPKCRVPCAELR